MPSRREFLRFLAGSPLFLALERQGQGPIGSPEQGLSVMDFEPAARAALPPAHFGYLASGVDDDATLRANREDFANYRIRARRLIDVTRVDLSVDLLGTRWDTPIVICPCGSQKAFHADGEIATARAARAKGLLQILSGVSTTSVEDVNAARGSPVWYQLYPTNDVAVAMGIVRRAAAAGCPVLVLTVDLHAGRNLETGARAERMDQRACSACHGSGMPGYFRRKPMFDRLDLSRVTNVSDPAMTWDYIARVRDAAPAMKVVLKGIVTREDALLSLRHGVDAIVVSNHGGRAEESGRSTISSLAEVVEAVQQRIPVLLDGGIRRGTDIFKALALGARAVGIGRPYLWGLAAFGQQGVEAVVTLLQRELSLIMRQAGTTDLASITPAHLVKVAS